MPGINISATNIPGITSKVLGYKTHSAIKFFIKDIADCIAASNTTLHFSEVHAVANKIIINQGGQSDYIFIKHPNIIIPKNFSTYWQINEAAQAISMGLPLATKKVITGTIDEMRKKFPNKNNTKNPEDFISNQKNPDVGQSFFGSQYKFQGYIGTDWKNGTGKTKTHGRNQVVITSLNDYQHLLQKYMEDLNKAYVHLNVKSIIQELEKHAENYSFPQQTECLYRNLHLFPPRWNPPLYVNEKFPLDSLTPEMKTKVIQALRKLRWLSKQAYEKNIPEDNLDGSYIQSELSEDIPDNFD